MSCDICFDDKNIITFQENGKQCGHSLCEECITNYVVNLKEENIDNVNILCYSNECNKKIPFSELIVKLQKDESKTQVIENFLRVYNTKYAKNDMILEEKFINEISLCHCPNCNKMIDDIVKSEPDQCSSMCCPHCKTMFCKACKYYITKEAAMNYMKMGNIDATYSEGEHEMIVHSHIWRKHPNQGIYLSQEYLENSHKKEIIHKIQLFSRAQRAHTFVYCFSLDKQNSLRIRKIQ